MIGGREFKFFIVVRKKLFPNVFNECLNECAII